MNITYEEMLELSAANVKKVFLNLWRRKINEDYSHHADVIKELLLVKENMLTIDFGSHRIMNIIM